MTIPSRPEAYLHDFRPLSVGPALPQERTARRLIAALRRARGGRWGARDERAARLYERLGRGDFVRARRSAVPDYAGRPSLFVGRGEARHRPPLEARMAFYEKTALALAEKAFPRGEAPPDRALQVSCTGYAAPHALQRVAGRRGWTAPILHVGHMGCYAALPATEAAARMVRADAADGRARARASLFVVELCTLHLRPEDASDEAVVVNSLFADGAIRYEVSASPRPRSLALLASDQFVAPGTEDLMTWRLRDSAFAMTLDRAVPERLGPAIAARARRLLRGVGRDLSRVAHFAIHPGGPRVIDSALAALGAPSGAARHSREVLRTRGNMSSATLPHVWAAMLEDPAVRRGDLILSLAFGPGLTVASNLLVKR